MRCFCRVEYEGTRYHGWQSQTSEQTIQSVLEKTFSTVCRRPCAIVGAGRTDAGVHARGQGMHVDVPDETIVTACQRSVNALLPADIAIHGLQQVSAAFHARYSARERTYRYYMIFRKMPLWAHRAMIVTYPIDWRLVEQNCTDLLGKNDFTAFCASGFARTNKDCTVTRASLERGEDMMVFTISADRFVYKMVRSIVGTLLDIGRGRITDSMRTIIDSRNRRRVGETAYPCGLVLDAVTYNEV